MATQTTYYDVPEQYQGKTLADIRGEQNLAFRPDILAGFAGISDRQPLSSTLKVNLPEGYVNSGESQSLNKLFGSGMSPEDYIIRQRTAEVEKSKQPIISELESEKAPLTDRYNKIIESIRGAGKGAINQAGIDTATEFGKRGIPLSSGAYDQYLQNRTTPIQSATDQSVLSAEGSLQDRLSGLAQSIATLKASVSPEAFQQAMSLIGVNLQKAQAETQANQFQQNLDLQKQQLDLQKQQANKPSQQFITSGGRNYLVTYDTNGNITNKVDLGSTSSGSSGATASQKQALSQDALNAAASGKTLGDLQTQFGAKLGTDTVVKLYTAATKYGTPTEPYAQEILGMQAKSPTSSSSGKAWWEQ